MMDLRDSQPTVKKTSVTSKRCFRLGLVHFKLLHFVVTSSLKQTTWKQDTTMLPSRSGLT